MKASKPKCTAIEKKKRLFIIQGWILEGVPDQLIVKQILSSWGIDVRQAQRYVKEAYTSWAKIEGVSIEMKRELKIAKLKQDIRSLKPEYRGTPAGLRAVNDIEKEITKLEGLELSKKIQISGDPEKPVEVRTKVDTSMLSDEILLALEKAYTKK